MKNWILSATKRIFASKENTSPTKRALTENVDVLAAEILREYPSCWETPWANARDIGIKSGGPEDIILGVIQQWKAQNELIDRLYSEKRISEIDKQKTIKYAAELETKNTKLTEIIDADIEAKWKEFEATILNQSNSIYSLLKEKEELVAKIKGVIDFTSGMAK